MALNARVGWVGLAIAAVAAAVVAFLWMQRETAVVNAPAQAASAPGPGPAKSVVALSEAQLQRMVEQSLEQVGKQPKDASAWAMLAHSYDMLGKFAESRKAYATLVQLLPGNAQVLADYADALAVANGRRLEGEPAELVKKALAIDPKNMKALALAGSAALERKDYTEALGYWERARAVSNDDNFTRQLDASIADAKAVLAGTKADPKASPAAGVAAVVSGRVSLADDLVKQAPPDATVFIFARPAAGSRMPVALLRRRVRDLPVDFKLDDSSAMVPQAKLSQQATVVIGARISRRGDVMPQAGDMQGWSAPVSVGTQGIKLEISEVIK
jgi:cytochrome c-type biogenesis protein CcmH